jgi:hypothetical protein
MVVKPCTFIDEYHTQIGYNVFHICQFAEIMERNGASYMPEPEIMGDEAAWKVGKDRILAVQTCEDGYDYTLLDENYNEIDGGQVDNPELSMLEVRRDILESFGLERRELRAMFYEDVMEQAFEVGRQAVVVNDPIAELAFKLDRFAENFDPYEYMDQVDDVQAHIQEIKADLAAGNTAPYREFLNTAIEEAREETAVEVAKVLKSQLDKLDSPKRESVMEKLAQAAEKAAPASPSPKRKEPSPMLSSVSMGTTLTKRHTHRSEPVRNPNSRNRNTSSIIFMLPRTFRSGVRWTSRNTVPLMMPCEPTMHFLTRREKPWVQ